MSGQGFYRYFISLGESLKATDKRDSICSLDQKWRYQEPTTTCVLYTPDIATAPSSKIFPEKPRKKQMRQLSSSQGCLHPPRAAPIGVHWNPPGGSSQTDSASAGVGRAPGICISNRLPEDAHATSPQTLC